MQIRVLAVRQPWASLIVEGLKTIEIRSRYTNIRERVAIYATNNKYTNEEKNQLFGHFRHLLNNGVINEYICDFACSCMQHDTGNGSIIGTAELYYCEPMVITEKFHSLNEYKNLHLVPNWFFDYKKGYFFWSMEQPIKFPKPIPYKPPKGAVVWSKTDLPFY